MSKFAQQSPGAMSRSQKALSPLLRVALLLGVVIHLAAFWGVSGCVGAAACAGVVRVFHMLRA